MNNDEEFAFKSDKTDPFLETQLENFMNNYDELISEMKNTISNSNITKNNSDPKTSKRKNSNESGKKDSSGSIKRKRKSKTKSLSFSNEGNNSNNNNEEEINNLVTKVDEKVELKNFTSIEEIKDFYEYTENCLKMIPELGPPPNEEELMNHYVELPEKLLNKKLIVFDLDETLIHCELKNIEKADMTITVSLNNKKIRVNF